VKNNAVATIIDKTDNQIGTGSRYEIYFSSNEYWFRLFAVNGNKSLHMKDILQNKVVRMGLHL